MKFRRTSAGIVVDFKRYGKPQTRLLRCLILGHKFSGGGWDRTCDRCCASDLDAIMREIEE